MVITRAPSIAYPRSPATASAARSWDRTQEVQGVFDRGARQQQLGDARTEQQQHDAGMGRSCAGFAASGSSAVTRCRRAVAGQPVMWTARTCLGAEVAVQAQHRRPTDLRYRSPEVCVMEDDRLMLRSTFSPSWLQVAVMVLHSLGSWIRGQQAPVIGINVLAVLAVVLSCPSFTEKSETGQQFPRGGWVQVLAHMRRSRSMNTVRTAAFPGCIPLSRWSSSTM